MHIELLILADDFTGALDTGIHFARNGALTRVITDPACDFSATDVQVLVIDTETRHLPPAQAGEIIADVTCRAYECGIRRFYKKTDSALRGNVGAELAALLEAAHGTCLHFLPSFPAMNRLVREGILYIDGIPVKESSFGKDPFDPVLRSDVKGILAEQTNVPVQITDDISPEAQGILVYNAETDERLLSLSKKLPFSTEPLLVAGCAGFASSLTRVLSFDGKKKIRSFHTNGFLVISGSVNEVTQRQIAFARKHGFGYAHLGNREKLTDYLRTPEGEQYLENLSAQIRHSDRFVIDTIDEASEESASKWGTAHGMNIKEIGSTIADSLACLAARMIDRFPDRMLLLTGGDVLYHTMQGMGVTELDPQKEVSPGVILSSFSYNDRICPVITKSGGFGTEDLLVRLAGDKEQF